MKDRVVLVTGSTDGIGRETALELARMGAEVIVHGRNSAKASVVADAIRRESRNASVAFLSADFSDLENDQRTLAHDAWIARKPIWRFTSRALIPTSTILSGV